MTQLQILNKYKRDAKHQMFLTRPLRGYLGNQYDYWNTEWNAYREKIKEIKNSKTV